MSHADFILADTTNYNNEVILSMPEYFPKVIKKT